MSDDETKAEATNVNVMVRVRLFNRREIKISEKNKDILQPCLRMRGKTCAIVEYYKDDKGIPHEREREAFDFDECFWSLPFDQCPLADNEYATQLMVYQKSGLLALQAAFDGFNVCIFAYGQTGSGKTYSMLGCDADPGISPRLVDDMFTRIDKNKALPVATTKCRVECMFFEIYNEKVRDLFNKKSKIGEYDQPRIRQHPTKGVYVEGLTRKEVTTAEETKALIEKGTNERAQAETKMNAHSSRSHAIFQIQVIQNDALKGVQRVSTINLVDLAGSEKISMSGATGKQLVEAKNINLSLSTLRRVIDILIDNSTAKRQQIPPFRESVLTYVLSDSLGGNSKTQMLATVSPHESNIEDTIGTLRYALRAKSIVCEAKVNEEKSAEVMKMMQEEILKLRQQAREGGGGGAVPIEIQQELAEREEEMKKMEEEQSKMEELLEEAKKKEEVMKVKMAEIDQAKQELSVAVAEQNREKFASAFRNAFLISTEKKRTQMNEAELEEARAERLMLREKYTEIEHRMEQVMGQNDELQKQNDYLARALDELRSEADAKIAHFELQNRDLTLVKASLESQLSKMEEALEGERRDRLAAEEVIERNRTDMIGLTHAVERGAVEKTKIRDTFEADALQHGEKMTLLRKRKDMYKQRLAEEEAVRNALQGSMKSNKEDRNSLLETIKAQQKLLSEKDFLIASLTKQFDTARSQWVEAEGKHSRQEMTIRTLSDSLDEYQKAAAKWMSDLSIKEKEIQRLRMMNEQSRSLAEQYGSPVVALSPSFQRTGSGGGSQQRQSPRRTQSPSAAQSRSPFFQQPRIDFVGSPSSRIRRN